MDVLLLRSLFAVELAVAWDDSDKTEVGDRSVLAVIARVEPALERVHSSCVSGSGVPGQEIAVVGVGTVSLSVVVRVEAERGASRQGGRMRPGYPRLRGLRTMWLGGTEGRGGRGLRWRRPWGRPCRGSGWRL